MAASNEDQSLQNHWLIKQTPSEDCQISIWISWGIRLSNKLHLKICWRFFEQTFISQMKKDPLKKHCLPLTWRYWRSFFMKPEQFLSPCVRSNTLRKTSFVDISYIVLYGYESKPWYPSEPQNSWDLWMFIPLKMVSILTHTQIDKWAVIDNGRFFSSFIGGQNSQVQMVAIWLGIRHLPSENLLSNFSCVEKNTLKFIDIPSPFTNGLPSGPARFHPCRASGAARRCTARPQPWPVRHASRWSKWMGIASGCDEQFAMVCWWPTEIDGLPVYRS